MERELVSNNISYSLLKSFDEHGPIALLYRQGVFNAGTSFGSKVDDLMSLSKEKFNKKYLIVQDTITIKDLIILSELVVKLDIDFDNITDDNIDTINKVAIKELLFKVIKKDETRIKKFNNSKFYDHCKNLLSGKELVSAEDYAILLECKQVLLTHKSTKYYYNTEGIYQFMYNYNFMGRNVKIILDKLIIDDVNKTIQGADLKSGAVKAKEFPQQFFTYKYYIQGALYQKGLEDFIKTNPKYSDYTLKPFVFNYINRFKPSDAKTFIYTQDWYDKSFAGFKTLSGFKYKGIIDLIDEVKWHIKTQIFDESQEFSENNEITLNSDFIK